MLRFANPIFWYILLSLSFAGVTDGVAEASGTVPVHFIAAGSVLELQQSGRPPLIVDVRARDEFDAAHIKGAVSLPLRELDRRYTEIPREGLVVLY